jgi:hypothetical protein
MLGLLSLLSFATLRQVPVGRGTARGIPARIMQLEWGGNLKMTPMSNASGRHVSFTSN